MAGAPSAAAREVDEAVRRLAEDPAAYAAIDEGWERIERPGYCLVLGPVPSTTLVQRLRLRPEGVEAAVAEVRQAVAARGHTDALWWVGPSATPSDLRDRLRELGIGPATRPPYEPRATAMALLAPPPPATPGVVARKVMTFEEFRLAAEIGWDVFGLPAETRRLHEGRLEEAWRRECSGGRTATFLAFLDGAPVAQAGVAYADAAVILAGGATRPEARGLGAYRALVRARWDDAVSRGTPALVIQAGAASRPILEGAGFVPLGVIEILLDDRGADATAE
jgi:hypothetical protein